MKWISRLEFIIGIWILISPWILGYSSFTPALWSNIISGAVVALIGLWGVFGTADNINNKINKP